MKIKSVMKWSNSVVQLLVDTIITVNSTSGSKHTGDCFFDTRKIDVIMFCDFGLNSENS